MNLSKLFEMQRELDARIEREHPRKENEDRLAKKVLALQVELGELCNCWRGFKYWSEDQEPRIKAKCEICDGLGNNIWFTGNYENGTLQECSEPCEFCDGMGFDDTKNPLLEEYVDCLHFVLSIGNELGKHDVDISCDYTEETITGTFNRTFETIGDLRHAIRNELALEAGEAYEVIFELLVGLGVMLGFTWDEIEQAYIEKNKVNHERQVTGY